MSVIRFEDMYVRNYSSGKKSLLERPNGDCVLLDRPGCSVYAVRPKQCGDYPFWPEILASQTTWLRETRRCPGLNTGDLHTAAAIQAILDSQTAS
jgi:hypothetical protein